MVHILPSVSAVATNRFWAAPDMARSYPKPTINAEIVPE